jgi:hypothetical protein
MPARPPRLPAALLPCLLGAVACAAGGGPAPKADGADIVDDSGAGGPPATDPDLETVPGVEPLPDIPGTPDALFADDRVIRVELELPADDWDALRLEARSMFDVLGRDCMSAPGESPFTWFSGDARVDGEDLGRVSVRKKGLIGSMYDSAARPSLRVDIDRASPGRRAWGLARLALNAAPQDPTGLRTCLADAAYAAVGVPAPRCALAELVVNGDSLGLYALVEPIDEVFTEALTGHAEVPLYEGTLSDLREGWTATFDPDSAAADPALLAPLVDAVASGDLDQIDEVIDVDAYLKVWAAEVLVGQWDGYAWNTNNFALYIDPTDGRARFVPWGPDAAWTTPYPGGGLDWIGLNAALPRAIAAAPGGLDRYRAALAQALADAGGGAALSARAAALAELAAPVQRVPAGPLADLRAIIEDTDARLAVAATAPAPDLSAPLPDPLCMREVGRLTGTFDAEVGARRGGPAEAELVWEGERTPLPGAEAYASARGGMAELYTWHELGGGVQLLPYFSFPAEQLVPGELVTDGTMRWGALYFASPDTSGEWVEIAWMEGPLRFDAAGSSSGDRVQGSYEAVLWAPAW